MNMFQEAADQLKSSHAWLKSIYSQASRVTVCRRRRQGGRQSGVGRGGGLPVVMLACDQVLTCIEAGSGEIGQGFWGQGRASIAHT